MKFILSLLVATFLISAVCISPTEVKKELDVCLSSEEMKLFQAINEYRLEKGLDKIPLSSSLCHVAKTHSKDLNHYYKRSNKCNLHTWSKNGRWSSCCYTSDHKQSECMWNKPRELTDYTGDGFEIAFAKYRTGNADPELTAKEVLDGWKKSKGHNAVIVNKSSFKNLNWQAIGVGMHRGYATVWFGSEKDNLESPSPCE